MFLRKFGMQFSDIYVDKIPSLIGTVLSEEADKVPAISRVQRALMAYRPVARNRSTSSRNTVCIELSGRGNARTHKSGRPICQRNQIFQRSV